MPCLAEDLDVISCPHLPPRHQLLAVVLADVAEALAQLMMVLRHPSLCVNADCYTERDYRCSLGSTSTLVVDMMLSWT